MGITAGMTPEQRLAFNTNTYGWPTPTLASTTQTLPEIVQQIIAQQGPAQQPAPQPTAAPAPPTSPNPQFADPNSQGLYRPPAYGQGSPSPQVAFWPGSFQNQAHLLQAQRQANPLDMSGVNPWLRGQVG